MKKRFRSTRIFFSLVFFGVIAASAILFYQAGMSGRGESAKASPSGPEKKQAKPPVVEVVSAARQEISELLTLTGTVAPQRTARLASPAEGPAGSIRVREGDMVEAGDELLLIGRKQGVDAFAASLRTELKNASDDLERTRRLVETNALAEESPESLPILCPIYGFTYKSNLGMSFQTRKSPCSYRSAIDACREKQAISGKTRQSQG